MARPFLSPHERSSVIATLGVAIGAALGVGAILLLVSLVSHDGDDSSHFYSTDDGAHNAFGAGGAEVSGDLVAWLGYGAYALLAMLAAWSIWLLFARWRPAHAWRRAVLGPFAVLSVSALLSAHGGELAPGWGLGGILGDRCLAVIVELLWIDSLRTRLMVATLLLAAGAYFGLIYALGGGQKGARALFRRMGAALWELISMIGGAGRAAPQVYESVEGAYPRRPARPPRAPNPSRSRRTPPAAPEERVAEEPELAAEAAPSAETTIRPALADRLCAVRKLARARRAARREEAGGRLTVPPTPESRRVEPGFSSDPRQIGDGATLDDDGALAEAPVADSARRIPFPAMLASSDALTQSHPGSADRSVAAPGKSSARPRRRNAGLDILRDPRVDPAPSEAPQPDEQALDALWRAADHDKEIPPLVAPRRKPEPQSQRWTIGRGGPGYAPPPLDLLEADRQSAPDPDIERRLALKAEQLQRVINEYGVRGDVIDVSPGPVVSQFEFEPGPGVKVARVVGLADDIARAMSSVSTRIAPIPGKNVIGIELPNAERETVALRRLLEDTKFITHGGALPIALGVDLGGAPVTVDLARAPHLLIAGATGSGKSVAVNAILLSLLYRLPPAELRLLLIDPKKLELRAYGDGPHLLAPVVTDPREAVSALKWAIREMERRYELMSKLGVRGLEGYNARAEKLRGAGGVFEIETKDGFDPETGAPIVDIERLAPDPMARIVIVIDELSELMMVAGKEIEHCVLRLAQMGRASGIHLVAATQRPSVDVITGLIKANFPTRISLQTVSVADSKTILDRPGAERLLGKGDMLYSAGGGQLQRVHCAFVSDEEVIAATEHLAAQGPADDQVVFDQNEPGGFDDGSGGEGEEGDDAYYERAKRIVFAEQRASASFLQRRLSIGYNRASRLIEQMERDGVVSPLTSSGKREVLGPQDSTQIHRAAVK